MPALPHLREELGNRRVSMFRKVPESLSKLDPGHVKTSTEASAGAQTLNSSQRDSAVNTSTPSATPGPPQTARKATSSGEPQTGVSSMQMGSGFTMDDVIRAHEVINATAPAFKDQRLLLRENTTPTIRRQASHVPMHDREISRAGAQAQDAHAEHAEGQGGHDAPNWSRTKSYSVLMGCTFLYAIIAGKIACEDATSPADRLVQKSSLMSSTLYWMAQASRRNSLVSLCSPSFPTQRNS